MNLLGHTWKRTNQPRTRPDMPAPAATKPGPTDDLTDLSTIQPGEGTPSTDPESSVALDDLLKKATGEEAEKKEEEAAAAKKAEDDAAAKKKADDEAAKKKDVDLPALGDDAEKKKANDDAAVKKKADDEAAAAKRDDFDAIELPPHSKPKATESFEKVKTLARERITAATKERDELREKLTKAEEAAKGGLSAEHKKELEELRSFRQKMDVEADPSFKQWDTKIAENIASVTAKLKAHGFTDEHFKQIEKLGGIAQVDWEGLGEKLPANLRKYIENKVFENDDLAEKKKASVEVAKKNAGEFLATRQKESEVSSETFSKEATAEFETFVPKMEWLAEKTAAKDAKPEEKAAIDAHNALVKEVRADVADAIADNTPRMRAILAVGWAQLKKLRVEHAAMAAQKDAKISTLEKELAEKVEHLDKIKKSSTTRLRDSSAPDGKVKPAAKNDVSEHGSDALDRLRAEAEAAAEAKA